ncbi:MAG: two-component regulator propeller domain-containing protein, partial [Candidatus Latescibacterota bacterium]
YFFYFPYYFLSASFAPAEGVWTEYPVPGEYLFNWISALTVSPNGIVWAGFTKGKVARFDGSQWSFFSIPGDSSFAISSIAALSNEDVWVTDFYGNGIRRFQSGNWISYTESNGLPDNGIAQIYVDPKGTVWASTGKGVAFFREGKWELLNKDDSPFLAASMTCAPDGAMWFGYMDLFRYKDSLWTTYRLDDFDGDRKGNYYIRTITADISGKIWFGSHLEVLVFDGTSLHDMSPVSPIGVPAMYESPYVAMLAVGPRNSVWCTIFYQIGNEADFGGVFHYDGDSWTRYSQGNGLPTNQVKSIAVSPAGAVWVPASRSLCRFTHTITAIMNEKNEPPSFTLLKNYPNPFNPSTTISFSLPSTGKATLSVYSISGQKVRELVLGYLPAGVHSVVWDGRDDHGNSVSSGVYISRLESGGRVSAARMLFMK